MIQHLIKQILLVALINMSLCVPQFDLVPVNCATDVSRAIETQDEAVDAIPTLILESIFGIDIPFPIHEDAHFLEKDFVVKRLVKGVPLFSCINAIVIGWIQQSTKQEHAAVPDTIILSKFFGFIARLHYF
jgi:hypothetical protein